MQDDSTPVHRVPLEIRTEIRRARSSSKHAISTARVVALELLRNTVVEYDPDDERALIQVFAEMMQPYLRSHAQASARLLQGQVDTVSAEASRLRSELARLRRAIVVDFLAEGDIEALVTAALEGIDAKTVDDL